ncbi:MAG: ABC transporter permease [Candidatus Nitrosocaldus sp.]|nr:ABC transporter permease [Candidatus Nitrosocaldus sp.]MDW7999381.1 ABC transporter permease [Candidatus Nitrosocaldus sp.]
MSTRIRSVALKLSFYSSLLLVWYAVAEARILPDYVLPSPIQVAQEYASSGARLLTSLAISMQRLFIGFTISLLAGFAFGYAMARNKTLYDTVGSLIIALASLPSIVWVPIGMIWFGYSEAMVIFVIVASTVFAFMLSTYTSIKNVPPIYIKVARNMGAKGFHMLAYVMVPAATPSILIGIRNAWSFSWRGLMNAEVVSGYLGLGFMLESAREVFNMAHVIAVVLIIMAIGLLVDVILFSRVERYVEQRWGLR